MTMRDEMRSMGKGIRDTQKHIVVSEHVDYIFGNFVKQKGVFESEEAEQYIKEIKPQSIRDAVTLKLVNELNSFFVGYSTRFDDPDMGASVIVVSKKNQDNIWHGHLVSRSEKTIIIWLSDLKLMLGNSGEIAATSVSFNISDVDYSFAKENNS